MFRSFFYTKEWLTHAWLGALFLISSLWVQVQFTVLLNSWYKRFYDLLQKSSDYYDAPQEGIRLFFEQLIGWGFWDGGDFSFLVIAIPYVFLAVFTNWFTRIYVLWWREAMTFHYVDKWRNVEHDIEGSSQRIQEDCARFARIVEHLGAKMLRSVMILVAFLPVLWSLSAHMELPVLKDIQGSLVWLVVLICFGGLICSWLIGWFLPGLEYNNQKVEAAFRKDLVYAEDNKKQYAQLETLQSLFFGIRLNYKRLYKHYSYFDLWSHTYEQIMVIVPYLLIGIGLFTGSIQLGTMVQMSNAFGQVHSGFYVFMDNWVLINELRSIHKRLKEFEQNIQNV